VEFLGAEVSISFIRLYTVVDYPRSGVFQGTSWILRDRRIGLPQICQQHPPCVSRIGKRKYHTPRRASLSYWYYKFSTVMNEHPRVRVVELAGLIPYVLVHTGISSNQMNESDGKPTATRKKSLRRGLRWPEGSGIAPPEFAWRGVHVTRAKGNSISQSILQGCCAHHFTQNITA